MRTNYDKSVKPHYGHSPLVDIQNDNRLQAEENLIQVIGDAHDILVRVTTMFPFTIFPDTITIDRTKLTITHREFFKTAEVLSIRIEDILNVAASVGPFFGSIQIHTRFFDTDKPYLINHFSRADALKIKRITQGYVLAKQKNVDCSALSTQELTNLLDELGKVLPAEKV